MVRKRALKEGGQRDVCSEVKIDYEMQPMVAEKGQAFRYAVGAPVIQSGAKRLMGEIHKGD